MIIQKDNPILREKAKNLSLDEILSKKTQDTISQMIKDLDSQDDGVAIAAPQIGEPLRIFVVSGKVFDMKKGKEGKKSPHLVCINPKLVKLSKEKKWLPEGCLSVRYLYGNVHRHTKATIEFINEKGENKTKGASGLLAQIFQHEIDHLDGVLFTDKAKDVENLPPQNYEQ